MFLVDDENGQLELMRSILSKMKEDLEIECFTQPSDALEAMRKSPAHIVISDIRMPQMDGLSFIRQIRQDYPDTIIAILSAYGDFSYAKQAIAFSVVDYLVKPVNRQELKALLDNIYARLHPKEFPYVAPRDFEKLERSVISAVCQGNSELAASAMEQFLAKADGQTLPGSHILTAQNFSHLMLALHRQVGMEITDTVFHDIDSCTSLEELCMLVQTHIAEFLHHRRKPDDQSSSHIIDEIIQYMEEHLEQDISLNSIAREFHFNTSYLSNLFKRQTGTGLKEYMTQRRMERAKDLLCSTNLKIQQIASKCGYEDDSYFVQLFKRQTGFSPSQYRKRK